LSLLGGASFDSTLSVRSWQRMSSSLSVFRYVQLGASLALSRFARFGSAMAIVGGCHFGSSFAIMDSMCVGDGKAVQLQGWTVSWDSALSKLKFLQDSAVYVPLSVTPGGGHLHGTWSAESIVSASDRRLKQSITPLRRALTVGAGISRSPASRVLNQLLPRRVITGRHSDGYSDSNTRTELRRSEARYQLSADEVRRVLPSIVHPSGSTEGVAYQDMLAVAALAAKERQRALDLHQAQAAAEDARLEAQEEVIRALEQELNLLRGRFARLQRRGPMPPP